MSGPIGKKASFFLDYQHRNIDNNDVVSAVVLNPSLVQTPFSQTLSAPNTLNVIDPRFDFELSPNNIAQVTYQFSLQNQQNLGVGQFALASQAYTLQSLVHTIRANDTQIIGPRFVNETRFQAIEQRYIETPQSLSTGDSCYRRVYGRGQYRRETSITITTTRNWMTTQRLHFRSTP